MGARGLRPRAVHRRSKPQGPVGRPDTPRSPDTAATLAFEAGASVKEVANMLGHANPAITLRTYTGVLDSMSAATDDKLDAAFKGAAL